LLKQPITQFINDDDVVLIEDYEYLWAVGMGKKKRHYREIVYAGFVFDMASVPWLLRLFQDRHGLIGGPATNHDLNYVARGVFPHQYGVFQQLRGDEWIDVPTDMTRKMADKLFRRMMKEAGMGFFKRNMAYTAVRAGGWTYWNT